jgi:hypothetical protein
MKKILLLAISLMFAGAPALAGDNMPAPAVETVVETVDTTLPKGFKAVQMADGKTVIKKKSFAENHPKLHKKGRWVRRKCQTLQPVVDMGGSLANIALIFIKRK